MFRQTRLLTKALIINPFGLNEARFTNDKAKKSRFKGFLAIGVFLVFMLSCYSVGFGAGMKAMKLEASVPVLLFVTASLIILFFSMFKAGAVIFQTGSFQMTAALPVSSASIVISRFIKMYLSDLFFSAITVLPGSLVCARSDASFYINLLLGIIILPLLPLTAATAIGALITAISSRMKHKSLAASAIAIVACAAIVVLGMGSSSLEGQISADSVGKLIGDVTDGLLGWYFPAALFNGAVTNGNYLSMLILIAASLAIFSVMILILQRSFISICSALNASTAKNNYKMQSLNESSPLKSLWKREIRRYFASTVYITNTMIGYVLMAVMAVALLAFGSAEIDKAFGFEGISASMFPYLLAMVAVITPTTACSVSMEGKYWWVSQTLPIRSKDLWNSKILVNFIIAVPFLLISCVLSCIALQPSLIGILKIFVVPACYVIFSSILGIFINIHFPLMKWDADVRVVKQSASMVITMAAGVASVIPAVVLSLIFGGFSDIISFVCAAVLLVVSAVIYKSCSKTDIRTIE